MDLKKLSRVLKVDEEVFALSDTSSSEEDSDADGAGGGGGDPNGVAIGGLEVEREKLLS